MIVNIVGFIFAVLLLGLGCLIYYQKYSRFSKLLHRIPGPPGLPILGNLFHYIVPLDEFFVGVRKRGLKHYPIYKEWILHVAAVSVLSPEDVEIVLSSTKHIKKSQIYDALHTWLQTGLLTSTGKKWQTRRKILTPAFHFTVLREFVNTFNETTLKLARSLEKRCGEPVDLNSPITEMTLSSIVEAAMGTKLTEESNKSGSYKQAVCNYGQLAVYRMCRPWLYDDLVFWFTSQGFRTRNVVKTLHNFSRNVIMKRKQDKKHSHNNIASRKKIMLDILLKAQSEGADIDDEGIREEVDTFMFEGHDTTSSAICSILLVLANHKKIQDDIRQEIIEVLGDSEDRVPTYNDLQQLPFTDRCIKECLRLYPSVPFIARDALDDIETATGYTIPKGSMIHIWIYDIHRNPNLYPDPERFDPDRFLPENINKRHPFAYIPFSAGPRNCIGQKFAMLELKALLCGILRKFELEPVTKLEDMVFTVDLILRTVNELQVKFLPRKKGVF